MAGAKPAPGSNARLIAAAPELLELVVAVMPQVAVEGRKGKRGVYAESQRALYQRMVAVVARVKGEPP